jgi:pimeloyl-ACP methyl ester carboxylesterase
MEIHGWESVSAYRSGFICEPSTYYEFIDPRDWNGEPHVLMVTGGLHSGACYLSTPDGRPGWAHAFLRHGYKVVLVDWPGVGRSGYVAPAGLSGELIVAGIGQVLGLIGQPSIVMTHSMSGAFGWKLLERHPSLIEKLIGVAPGPPGNLDERLGILLREDCNSKLVQMASGVSELRIDAVLNFDRGFHRKKLVGDSRRFPTRAFDAYCNSLLGISGRLVYERTNIDAAQLRVVDFRGYAAKPVAVVTGTADTDHPRAADARIVDWLNANGARATHLYLGDRGIEGNGHMMMLEDNSDAIAREIIDWIRHGNEAAGGL